MGNGVTGPGGPIRLPTQGTRSLHNVETVKQGETTLRQVAKRLGISEDALRYANPGIDPHHLITGQDIRLPEKSETKEDVSTSKTSKPQDEPDTKAEGSKAPTNKKGNWKTKPTLTGGTSTVVDGEGSSQARREQRDKVDSMRPRDERDIDPRDPPKSIKKDAQKKWDKDSKMIKDALEEGSKPSGGRSFDPADKADERRKVVEDANLKLRGQLKPPKKRLRMDE